jgi:hypothetical protein
MIFIILSLVSVSSCLREADPGTTTVDTQTDMLVRMASVLIHNGYRTHEAAALYLYNLDPDFLDDKFFDDFFPLCFRIAYVRWRKRWRIGVDSDEEGAPLWLIEDMLVSQLNLQKLQSAVK